MLRQLVESLGSDSDKFWQAIREHGTPFIENMPNSNEKKLSFVVKGKEKDNFKLVSSLCGSEMFRDMHLIEGTDIWCIEINNVPADARISYQFFNTNGFLTDINNSNKIPGLHNPDQNFVSLPNARPQPFLHRETLLDVTEKIESENRLIHREINFENSNILADVKSYMENARLILTDAEIQHRMCTKQGNKRNFWIHFPPGCDLSKKGNYKVVLHLDGKEAIHSMQVPAIMENAMKDQAIQPTITIFLDVGNRNIEYGLGEEAQEFSDFIAKEFIPSLQHQYPAMSTNPSDITIAGFSMGGNAAAHFGTRHPEVFGNVISQSGSFWMGSGSYDPVTGLFKKENEGLLHSLAAHGFPNNDDEANMCFYLNVGSFEESGDKYYLDATGRQTSGGTVTHNEANGHFRDFLINKKLPVTFVEYSGDHNFAEWQGGLIEGIRATQEAQQLHLLEKEEEITDEKMTNSVFGKTSYTARKQTTHIDLSNTYRATLWKPNTNHKQSNTSTKKHNDVFKTHTTKTSSR